MKRFKNNKKNYKNKFDNAAGKTKALNQKQIKNRRGGIVL